MKEGVYYQSKYVNSWALIIGINDYQKVPSLSYAKNDATAMADILEKKFGFQKDNIALLIDGDATGESIKKQFLEFTNESKVGQDDRLLIFYAGHGHTVTGNRGDVGYLVPVDGDIDDISSLIRWDEFTRNADLIPAKHIFFLMDACYGGLAFLRSPSFGNMRFLGDMLKRYSRQVLTAGKANEVVSDGNGTRSGHSIFTAHLLDALDGLSSTGEGIITASGIMSYVYNHVSNDQYSHQTPHYGFIDGDGDFIFDTSILDNKKELTSKHTEEESGNVSEIGGEDVLVNTSSQISTLAESNTHVVDKMKELLSDSSKKIQLDDFVAQHIREFLNITDLRNFSMQDEEVNNEGFVDRLNRYEEYSKSLQQIVILLSKWGDSQHLQQLEKIFVRLAETDKGSTGITLWFHLSWYPIQYLMYSAGISALSANNYNALRIIFETMVRIESSSDRKDNLISIASRELSAIHDQFKWIPGHDRHYVPRSEHLFTALQPVLEDLLFLGRSYESLFDKFEVISAIEYAYVNKTDWGPTGRFGWKHHRGGESSPYNMVLEEVKKEGENWSPFKASLFNGSLDTFIESAEKIKTNIDKLSWW